MKKLYFICFILCFCANVFAQSEFQVYFNNGSDNKTIYYRVTSAELATVAVTFRGELPTSYREYTTYIVVPATVIAPAAALPPAVPGVTYHVTSVDANAFYDCTGLDSVLLPSSVTFIDSLAFGGCTILKNCVMPSDINFIGEKAFYNCRMLSDIELPTNITKISKETFRDCHSLTSVNIPDMVNTISEQAFLNCLALEAVNISSSVNKISTSSFLGCSSLNSINVDTDNTKFMSEDGVLYSYLQDTLILYPPKKAGVEFTTPNSIKSVGDYSFAYNFYLKKINFNNSLTEIGTAAFYNNTGLSVVNISDSVSYIGKSAFYNCKNLDLIRIEATIPPDIQDFTFYNVPNAVSVVVPCEFEEDYKDSEWGEYFTNIQGYCIPTDISEIEYQQEINIFPNPVKDDLFININDRIERVEIYSLSGNLMILENNFNNSTSLASIPQGVYLVKIITNKDVIIKKIIKN